MGRRGHVIEIFSADRPLCREVVEIVEFGKCRDCEMTVYDVRRPTPEIEEKMRRYRINAVPTIVIDGEIKVMGIPDFPWICGDEFYRKLKQEYPLK